MRAVVSWSGGKDSAFALYRILKDRSITVESLHTVVDATTGRVGLHGVPSVLIQQQAQQLHLPVDLLALESGDNSNAYETLMYRYFARCKAFGIEAVVFGDIFLEDLRQYREELLKPFGLKAIFPLWGMKSSELIDQFLNAGFKTLVCAADARYFDESQVGVVLNRKFMQLLPSEVDPCGENGEYHTFVCSGPIFSKAVIPSIGAAVRRTYQYSRTTEQGTVEVLESSFWFRSLEPVVE